MMCRISRAAQFLLILVAFGTRRHHSALQVSALPMYPSKSFAPSMKASSIASTIVAVTSPVSENDTRVEGECCVILTKSHVGSAGRRNGEGNADDEDGSGDDEADGVTLASVVTGAEGSSENITTTPPPEPKLYPIVSPGRHTPSVSILSTGNYCHGISPLLVAFTGFTPDVHHLTLRSAKDYSNHLHLYGGMPMRTDKVAKNLADVVRSEASSDGGRPFGVQALVVGDRPKSKQLQLYTIDPAGGCTHWSGGATAIGKGAELVRKCLHRCLRPNGASKEITVEDSESDDDVTKKVGASRGEPTCWMDALDRAMMAIIEAYLSGDEDGTTLDDWLEEGSCGDFGSDRVRATVAFTTQPRAGTAAETKSFGIYPYVVEDSYKRCMQCLANEKLKKQNGRRKVRKGKCIISITSNPLRF